MNTRDVVAAVLTVAGTILAAVGVGLWVAPGAGMALGGTVALGVGLALARDERRGIAVTRAPVSFTRPDRLAGRRKAG